jgi:Fungal fucose-specific lectin
MAVTTASTAKMSYHSKTSAIAVSADINANVKVVKYLMIAPFRVYQFAMPLIRRSHGANRFGLSMSISNGQSNTGVGVSHSASGVCPAAYAFEDQGTQHVIYVGRDFHINELWWDNNGWHHNDLTAATGAPLPAVDQSMTAYAFEDQGTQHVIYIGQNDFHINELWWDNNGWHYNDLTTATGAPLPGGTGGPLPLAVEQSTSAYAFEDEGTQHVIYIGGEDNHFHELWWDNSGWHHNDLTVAAGAPLPAVDQSWSAYAFEHQRSQHIIYVGGQDIHIHELWWGNNAWHHNDITTAAGAPLPSLDQGMSAYAFEDQHTQHVIYTGQDGHFKELWWAPD